MKRLVKDSVKKKEVFLRKLASKYKISKAHAFIKLFRRIMLNQEANTGE